MPSCNKNVDIQLTREHPEEWFAVRCIEGEGHSGKHQGHIWVMGWNNASRRIGFVTPIFWEDVPAD